MIISKEISIYKSSRKFIKIQEAKHKEEKKCNKN